MPIRELDMANSASRSHEKQADYKDTLTIRLHFIPALPVDNFIDHDNQPSVSVSRNTSIAALEHRVHSVLNSSVNHWKWVQHTDSFI